MEILTKYKLNSNSERKSFRRMLSNLVVPIAFQSFMIAAVSASDSLMLGLISQNALSSVSLASQITFVLSLFITVLVQGTTLLCAQYWGKRDTRSIGMIFGYAMRFMLAVTLIFSASAILIPESLMKLFSPDPVMIEYGARYLRIAGFSYLPSGVSQLYLCIMKNTSHTTRSTLISAACMILNLFLNLLLIFGIAGFPRMEIEGAALATSIAMLVQLIWTVADSCGKDRISLHLPWLFHIDPVLAADFRKYTLPIAGNYLFYGCGITVYAMIIGRLGSDAVAANSIASIVRNLVTAVSKGVASTAGIVIGNTLGRRENEKARVYGNRILNTSIFSGFLSAVIILVLFPLILKAASLTPEAEQILSAMLWINVFYVIILSINSTLIGGIFCAGGKSKFGMISDFTVIWMITIPLALFSAFVLHLPAVPVYLILSLDEAIKLPFVLAYFRKGSRISNITRNS